MDIKISFDETDTNKEFVSRLQAAYKYSGLQLIEKFFENRTVSRYDAATGIKVTETIQGDGVKEIEHFITKKFCDPLFQERIDTYFEENWERIFEECMVKALTHKANGVAFNRMKDLK